jgi:hypothetical protein
MGDYRRSAVDRGIRRRSGRITEEFETLVCFVLMLLFPEHYALFAWVFAALCFVTAAMRWWWGYRLLSQ